MRSLRARHTWSYSMQEKPSGRFEVTDHYELTERGGFVIGQMSEGRVRVGDSVPLPDSSTNWTIGGVEMLDNVSERKYWTALIFKERPTRAEVEAAFPVGSYVDVYEQKAVKQ